MRPSGRRKFSVRSNPAGNFLKYIFFRVLCTVFSFFTMKIAYKVKQVTEHRLYFMYSFYEYIVYNKHKVSGELDLPSCLLEHIDDFGHGFPT